MRKLYETIDNEIFTNKGAAIAHSMKLIEDGHLLANVYAMGSGRMIQYTKIDESYLEAEMYGNQNPFMKADGTPDYAKNQALIDNIVDFGNDVHMTVIVTDFKLREAARKPKN